MSKKYLCGSKKVIDAQTGEEITLRVIGTSEEFKERRGFVKFYDVFTKQLIMDKDIAGKAIVLLFYILGKLEMNKLEFFLSAKQACMDLGIAKITYRRWISILLKKNIIQRIERNMYRLNPECVYKGSAAKLIEMK